MHDSRSDHLRRACDELHDAEDRPSYEDIAPCTPEELARLDDPLWQHRQAQQTERVLAALDRGREEWEAARRPPSDDAQAA
jgi:hypothetical protein